MGTPAYANIVYIKACFPDQLQLDPAVVFHADKQDLILLNNVVLPALDRLIMMLTFFFAVGGQRDLSPQ